MDMYKDFFDASFHFPIGFSLVNKYHTAALRIFSFLGLDSIPSKIDSTQAEQERLFLSLFTLKLLSSNNSMAVQELESFNVAKYYTVIFGYLCLKCSREICSGKCSKAEMKQRSSNN